MRQNRIDTRAGARKYFAYPGDASAGGFAPCNLREILKISEKQMKNVARYALMVGLIAVVTSCATKPEEISASYVSHTKFANLNCTQLREEASEVSHRAALLTAKQAKRRKQDSVAVGVSLVLFWPAAFLVKGDGVDANQLASIKGEMKAIEEVNRRKKCGIKFEA
ncbi:MAG: hypothetical protein ABJL67_01625 [Sulfitobacter sp.]